jgi:protoporphyrinogen/coproporphyrinogen III oxidase
MKQIIVLGGGLAGLTTAFAIKRSSSVPVRIHILEKSSKLGGWLQTSRVSEGFLFESGARGIRPSTSSGMKAVELIELLGLQNETLLASPSSNKYRYIYYRNELQRVPLSLNELFTSPLTQNVIKWLLFDIFNAKNRDFKLGDESVYDYSLRRFGDTHVADILLDAVLSGIYAGDVKRLSASSVLSFLVENEPNIDAFGGLSFKLLSNYLNQPGRPSQSTAPTSMFVSQCSSSSSVSFVNGIQTLVKKLVECLQHSSNTRYSKNTDSEVFIHLNSEITSLKVRQSKEKANLTQDDVLEVSFSSSISSYSASKHMILADSDVSGNQHIVLADHVVSAIPAHALSKVMSLVSPSSSSSSSTLSNNTDFKSLSETLNEIPTASTATVHVGFHKSPLSIGISPSIKGFGYLIPTSERKWISPSNRSLDNHGILGMVWDSFTFPGQSKVVADALAKGMIPTSYANNDTLPLTEERFSSLLSLHPETRFSVMIGGANSPRTITGSIEDEEYYKQIALQALKEHLHINRRPDYMATVFALNSIPQYTVGHGERVARINELVSKIFKRGNNQLLSITGNSFYGVGCADTIATSLSLGDKLGSSLAI